ncbi:hypothetical protein PRZ48_010986 [Zasmidium cellare]|uniref:Uncharacterized protein n=1 Tax=Zasmidium cellare TaxID=395010 RepID=A0ABR0EB22_ZASCE|nr:hypothetical protein PRZ48_010986 [Zasmidium cellare]
MTYDMDSIVEATSLSHVTDIATNPPSHPNVPADYPRLPLVLYIARVPGSRDVFLTPIKPREKVVTAEDVQSSLYYVHINSRDDYEEPPARPSSVNTDASKLMPIRENSTKRKPVLPARPVQPPSPPYPSYDSMPDTQQPPSFPPRPQQISRKPIAPKHGVKFQQSPDLPVLPRRPLPSPPEEDDLDSYSLHQNNIRLLRRAEHSEENNPYLRHYEPTPPPIDPADMPEPGTLTLIRRDPSSSEQWNVASIYDPPVHEVSSAALRKPTAAMRTKRSGAPVYLDISNPSYEQFIDANRPDSRVSMGSATSGDSDPPPEGVFRRRLYMPGSKYAEHNYGHSRKFGSVGSLTPTDETSIRRTMRNSVDMSTTSSSQAMNDRRSKSYTFTSPWDGRCEFSTGTTGKSLKCRHYLPRGGITEVSELRFNLPTSSSRTATALSDKRSSYFHRMHGRALSSTDGDDDMPTFVIGEDGRLDLTLGQERAGGGFGGKQAKLGKLIIEPEGLKMLDLLVAANVGLWWRAYEKV